VQLSALKDKSLGALDGGRFLAKDSAACEIGSPGHFSCGMGCTFGKFKGRLATI
jgi:hypothetical protein